MTGSTLRRIDVDQQIFASLVQSLDIAAVTELGAAAQQCCRSRCHAKAHGIAQRQSARKAEDDTGQHAVASADRTAGLDRDRGKALASLRTPQQPPSGT